MTFQAIAGTIAALVAVGAYIPYGIDIVRGKVKPARSARGMLTLILIFALFQQRSLGSGWALAVTVGELAGSLAILSLSMYRGVGGLKRSEIVCYALLAIDLTLWLTTQRSEIALHLSILADLIAFTPVLIKSWNQPETETPLFYILGFIAPLLSIVAGGTPSYSIIVFPAYLALVNIAQLVVMYRPHRHLQK